MQKYRILVDTHGKRGGYMFSGQVKLLSEQTGERLVAEEKAEPYEEGQRYIHAWNRSPGQAPIIVVKKTK